MYKLIYKQIRKLTKLEIFKQNLELSDSSYTRNVYISL